MAEPSTDQRSPARRALDDEIAAQAPLPPPQQLPPEATPAPMKAHLARLRRPVAISGIVQNGAIYPVDPNVRLPEHSRVIIVATELQFRLVPAFCMGTSLQSVPQALESD